jgi:hypothetical protein
MLLDMLYTPWVYWGLDSVPKLVHALYGYLTGLLLYAYLARRLNGIYGLVGFFFFVSVPAVLRLSHWGYVDLGVTFYNGSAALFAALARGKRFAPMVDFGRRLGRLCGRHQAQWLFGLFAPVIFFLVDLGERTQARLSKARRRPVGLRYFWRPAIFAVACEKLATNRQSFSSIDGGVFSISSGGE